MMRSLLIAWFIAAVLHAVGLAATYPAPPSWSPEPAQRQLLRRSLTLLETSTPNRRHTVRVLFYGQSITQQAWWKEVESFLRRTYPDANLIVENRAIGGHASQLLVKTAEADLYPFRPDLVIFHVYGSHIEYENIIRRIRERTCADILLATDHIHRDDVLSGETDPQKLTPAQWDAWMNNVFLPETARKYAACCADVHAQWKRYLREHGLKPSDLLRDGIHLNAHGEWLMAELLKAYFTPLPAQPGYDPHNNDVVRTFPLNAKATALPEFTGTRVDLVFQHGVEGKLPVLVNGQPPSGKSELYAFTRVSPFPATDWPLLLQVGWRKPLVSEDWSLTIHSASDAGQIRRFSVEGSLTGPDGEGVGTNTFVSHSGRVVIEPADWNTGYSVQVFKRPVAPGQVVRWKTYLRGTDVAVAPATAPGVERVITVADGLTNAPHRLELGEQPARLVRAIRVYRPPLAR